MDVRLVLGELMKNKKIANATHNMYAYRIHCQDKNTFLQVSSTFQLPTELSLV